MAATWLNRSHLENKTFSHKPHFPSWHTAAPISSLFFVYLPQHTCVKAGCTIYKKNQTLALLLMACLHSSSLCFLRVILLQFCRYSSINLKKITLHLVGEGDISNNFNLSFVYATFNSRNEMPSIFLYSWKFRTIIILQFHKVSASTVGLPDFGSLNEWCGVGGVSSLFLKPAQRQPDTTHGFSKFTSRFVCKLTEEHVVFPPSWAVCTFSLWKLVGTHCL